MKYKQGDIVLIPFPFTDLSQTKRRPALVISNAKANQTGDYLLVQITSKIRTRSTGVSATSVDNLYLEIKDADYRSGVLPVKSFVRINKIFCLNESLIEKKVCAVTANFSKRLNQKISSIIKR